MLHIYVFLAVHGMQQWIIRNTNLILALDDVSLLDIHLIIKATSYMILKTTLFLSIGTWFLRNHFSFSWNNIISHSFVLLNLVLNLDHQNSKFPTTLPNSQSASPTSFNEPITESIPIKPILEPMITESLALSSSSDISTQPLRHSTRIKHPLTWHKDYLLLPNANQSTPSQGSLPSTWYPFSHLFLIPTYLLLTAPS